MHVDLSSAADGLAHSIRIVADTKEKMREFLIKEINDKKAELLKNKALHHDLTDSENLFSLVVAANEMQGPDGLTDEELVGNFFVYLLAGVCAECNDFVPSVLTVLAALDYCWDVGRYFCSAGLASR